jgi:hypothetical protein
MMGRHVVTAATVAVGLVLAATPALAGKGGNGNNSNGGSGNGGGSPGGSSIALAGVDGAAPAALTVGSQVTFDISTTATNEPWVRVACFQNGTAVYGQYWGFWSGYSPSAINSTMAANGVFTLGPTALWSSGSASCVGTLYMVGSNGKQTDLASTAFTVG